MRRAPCLPLIHLAALSCSGSRSPPGFTPPDTMETGPVGSYALRVRAKQFCTGAVTRPATSSLSRDLHRGGAAFFISDGSGPGDVTLNRQLETEDSQNETDRNAAASRSEKPCPWSVCCAYSRPACAMAASIAALVLSSRPVSGRRTSSLHRPSFDRPYFAPTRPGSMKIASCSGISLS